MSMPELGMCTLEEYEDSKRFLVKPERLCLGGLYVFACKGNPSLDWQACRFPARVDDITEIASTEAPYAISMSFSTSSNPEDFASSDLYLFERSGLMRLPVDQDSLEEAHLQHQYEKLAYELESIDKIKTARPRVMTVPTIIPAARL